MKLNQAYTQAIWNFAEALQGETQIESALSNCMEIMKNTIGCEAGLVWIFSESAGRLEIIASAYGQDLTGVTINRSQGIIGHVMDTGETLTHNLEIKEDSPLFGSDDALGIRVTSQLVTPLRMPGRMPFGVIQLINKNNGEKFDEADARLAENLSALIALDLDDKGFEFRGISGEKPLIELQKVVKEFQNGEAVVRVLKGIDLCIYPGEFLVILGESGCGKTTMMNIIGGMTEMTEGRFLLEGRDFSNPSSEELLEYRKDYIGFIFQSYNLMPNLSALENLQFIAEISRDPEDPEEMLKKVGLQDKAGNFPSQLSGGQQQRVSIARALTKNPKLILADEPTAALDYETSIEVLSILERIVRENEKTVVMITHNPEIAKMADRVVKLRNGLVSNIRINLHPLSANDLVW